MESKHAISAFSEFQELKELHFSLISHAYECEDFLSQLDTEEWQHNVWGPRKVTKQYYRKFKKSSDFKNIRTKKTEKLE